MMSLNDFVHKYKKLSSSSFFIEGDICDNYNYLSKYTRGILTIIRLFVHMFHICDTYIYMSFILGYTYNYMSSYTFIDFIRYENLCEFLYLGIPTIIRIGYNIYTRVYIQLYE